MFRRILGTIYTTNLRFTYNVYFCDIVFTFNLYYNISKAYNKIKEHADVTLTALGIFGV